ncbi:unnamed protein product [Peronospora belbahrii]|uniref:Uncharacterized protein n=1 Tax=Peronospora belbahrii TaxID=622444 RepID=A0AAU9KPP0_9STRA|nr:unnamed protein product [Peronospora belbahrii]
MDTFLQLDEGVYDDDLVGEPICLETQIQRHIVETNQVEVVYNNDQYNRLARIQKEEEEQDELSTLKTNEHERQYYLQRVLVIEKKMQEADKTLQQRIDRMKRILELKDPMEQLTEYLTLKQVNRRDENVDIVEDLLQCANRMMSVEDNELAALGAYFFCATDNDQWHKEGQPCYLL